MRVTLKYERFEQALGEGVIYILARTGYLGEEGRDGDHGCCRGYGGLKRMRFREISATTDERGLKEWPL